MARLYVNGQEVDKWENTSSFAGEEDDLVLELPDYQLVNKKNVEKWIADFTFEDAEKLESLTRLDCDPYVNKKVKITVQVLGPASKSR